MARGVTQEQVDQAIDQLLSDGLRPTIERVRTVLGTGSPNTLTRMLDNWWKALGERLSERRLSADVPAAPPEVSEAASLVWEAALKAAQGMALDAVAAQQQQLESDRVALITERDAALDSAAKAESRREAAETARLEIETRMLDLRRLADAQENQLIEVKGRMEALANEVRLLQSALSKSAQAIEELRGQQVTERERLESAHRAAEDHWLKEVDQLRQERAAASKRVQQLETSHRDLQEAFHRHAATAASKLSDVELRESVALSRASSLEEELQRVHHQLSAALAARSAPKPPRQRRKLRGGVP